MRPVHSPLLHLPLLLNPLLSLSPAPPFLLGFARTLHVVSAAPGHSYYTEVAAVYTDAAPDRQGPTAAGDDVCLA